jgi:hypothetical protein
VVRVVWVVWIILSVVFAPRGEVLRLTCWFGSLDAMLLFAFVSILTGWGVGTGWKGMVWMDWGSAVWWWLM